MARRRRRPWWVAIVLVLLLALGAGAAVVYYTATKQPGPWAERCSALVLGDSAEIDLEQSRNASIISGVAARRGLPPRAVTIALATAFQESGIRNLSYGDRDSIGIFQQRPSQAWGTRAQIMDPYYASRAFYAALAQVNNWQNADVGDVAQKVQRSGYPDAYDKHVTKSKLLASSLSGETPASFSCVVRGLPAGNPGGLVTFFGQTLPTSDEVSRSGTTVTVRTASTKNAWQAASIAVANAKTYGVRSVSVGDRTWQPSATIMPRWSGTSATTASTVVIELA